MSPEKKITPSKLYTIAEEKLASQAEEEKKLPDPPAEEAGKVIVSNIVAQSGHNA